ncbi:hypothetical protein [Mesorhizobium caraganae]|uniref:hypothetical protein n=1 Tax=Mesorhizobium caraganae TaxID=483206 RepID=UPI001FF0279C|nr:hypothetical protein [Mesorhizobium caraganae]
MVAATGLMQILPAKARDGTGILRGSGLEIVDSEGRLRSSISILPATAGEAETVLFRLIPENGQPSVKIAASTASAGLSFVGGDPRSRRTRNPAQDGGAGRAREVDRTLGEIVQISRYCRGRI